MPNFVTMPSFLVLKKHLQTLFRPPKKSIFDIHDPHGVKYIFQLRVGLSPLREHNFLFKCPLDATQRASLAASVIAVLILQNPNHLASSVAVYGHPDLLENDNTKIIEATIKFLKETTRFT